MRVEACRDHDQLGLKIAQTRQDHALERPYCARRARWPHRCRDKAASDGSRRT
jgi:hypothetical protein